MGFSIKIKELVEKGMSPKEFYQGLLLTVHYEIMYLRQIYTSSSIDDLQAYPLQICSRIIKQTKTIGTVIETCEDYVSSNALIRSLADSISSLILIYDNSEGEEMKLRHYLYIMDGLSQRVSLLPDNIENDGRITKNDYEMLKKQIERAKLNYLDAFNHSESKIHELAIYGEYKKNIDLLIKNRQWKFKDLNTTKAYKWKDIYDVLEFKSSSLFSSLSDFVHGLSTSNLIIENEPETYEPLYCYIVSLLGKLKVMIEKKYNIDIISQAYITLSAIKDPEFPESYRNNILNKVDIQTNTD